MSLRARLTHDDPEIRLEAARGAGADDPGIVELLLDMALHDTEEVRTIGGIAEMYERISDRAAEALRRILGRKPGIDDRVRAAVLDQTAGDEQVARLLYFLGPQFEPLRLELETHPEARIRLRSLQAILSTRRTVEVRDRFITDPDPAVRAEALNIPGSLTDPDLCVRLMLEDPGPAVRRAAAQTLRYRTEIGTEPFLTAYRNESDVSVRRMLLSCLSHRRRDHENAAAIATFLNDADYILRSQAAQALSKVRDASIVELIADRIPVEEHSYVLMALLRHPRLLAYAPQLQPLLEERRADPRSDGERHALDTALASGGDVLELRLPDGTDLLLAFGEEHRTLGTMPVHAARVVPCPGCGTSIRTTGTLEWRYRDDDHFAYAEDGYEADLRGACHRCAAAARRVVLVTGERDRTTGICQISWSDLPLSQ